jgi:hypothetical protein
VRTRLLRITWVLVTNGMAAYFALYGSADVQRLKGLLVTNQPVGLTWQDYSRAAVPLIGILLEVFGIALAKYVNIGYFAVLVLVWGTICLYNWHDLHARVYSFLGFFLALLVACADLRLYRNRSLATNTVP